jgi:hypothetical protein
MKTFVIILCILSALFLITLPFELKRRRLLQERYWDRVCTGKDWKRRFPTASKTEIREFLVLFVDAFAFPRKRRLCFSPDDRVIDIYRTIYPSNGGADALEMETLVDMIEERYGVEVAKFGRDGITLGEIYEHTHRVA